MKQTDEEDPGLDEPAPVFVKIVLTAAPFVLMFAIFLLYRWLGD